MSAALPSVTERHKKPKITQMIRGLLSKSKLKEEKNESQTAATEVVKAFDTFTCFSDLPQELQDKIWKEALLGSAPRVVEYAETWAPAFTGVPAYLHFTKTRRTPFPPLLHACHDSRTMTFEHYDHFSPYIALAEKGLSPVKRDGNRGVLFDYSKDILYLGSPRTRHHSWYSTRPRRMMSIDPLNCKRSFPKYVMLDYRWRMVGREKVKLLFCLLVALKVEVILIQSSPRKMVSKSKGDLEFALCTEQNYLPSPLPPKAKSASWWLGGQVMKHGINWLGRVLLAGELEHDFRAWYTYLNIHFPSSATYTIPTTRWHVYHLAKEFAPVLPPLIKSVALKQHLVSCGTYEEGNSMDTEKDLTELVGEHLLR